MKQNFDLPQFLLAEIPVKDNSSQDNRLWIYCTRYLSLIEAVCLDDFETHSFNCDLTHKHYIYRNTDGVKEQWMLIIAQNNIHNVSGDNPEQVLDNAYAFLATYLRWEDENIDEKGKSTFN